MLISAALLTPLIAAAIITLAGVLGPQRAHRLRRTTAIVSPLTVLPAGLLTLAGEVTRLDVPWLLFGAEFAVDEMARSLTLIAVLLYGAALMSISWVKLRDAERGSGALSAFLLVCFAGNICVYLAADPVTFYLGFVVLSFSAAGLVIHYRTRTARRATVIYLVLSVVSETAVLAGLLLVTAAPEQTGWIVTLLLIGFGVKAGTVPLHVWLPLAHPAAPPAASAVLSGAMVKAGLVGLLRFLPTENDDASVLATAGNTLLVLALLGAFAAVLIGVLQDDPKVILAYSTISQMGFITALVAVGVLVPELAGVTASAAVLYAVHHGLAKGALFLGVPVVKHYAQGWAGILVWIGMLGAGLAVAGAPFTSGAYGKYVSKEAVEGINVLGLGLDHILPLVATGSTVLLMRFAVIMWRADREPRRRPDGELFSWLAVCTAGVLVPWLIGQHWISGAEDVSWTASALWDATWPMLLGIALGLLVWRLAVGDLLPSWLGPDLIPAGDLIVPEESAVLRVRRAEEGIATRSAVINERLGTGLARLATPTTAGLRVLVTAAEQRVSRWEISGTVIVLVLTAVVAVLTWGWWL